MYSLGLPWLNLPAASQLLSRCGKQSEGTELLGSTHVTSFTQEGIRTLKESPQAI